MKEAQQNANEEIRRLQKLHDSNMEKLLEEAQKNAIYWKEKGIEAEAYRSSRNRWRGWAIFLIIAIITSIFYFNWSYADYYSPSEHKMGMELLQTKMSIENTDDLMDAIYYAYPDGYLRGYLQGIHSGAGYSLGYIDGWLDGYNDTNIRYAKDGEGYDEGYEKGKHDGANYLRDFFAAKVKASTDSSLR